MPYKVDLKFLDDLESFIEEIPVEDLEVDPSLQRPLDANRVRAIFKTFTPKGVGTLAVSRRGKHGGNIVVDGQHRLEVLRLKLPEGGPKTVRCEVFENLTHAQEAALFLTLNHSTKPRAIDQFRVAVEAGEPTAVAVKELLDSYGFQLATFPRTGNIAAVDVMRRIYLNSQKKGYEPNTLQLTLLVVERAWKGAPGSATGIMLDAIAAMINEYGEKLNIPEFIARLMDHKPKDLIYEGRQMAGYKKVLPTMGLAEILVGKYNVQADGKMRRGSARLWDWRRKR